MKTEDLTYIRVTMSAKPKRKPNLVRWMKKHRVSGAIMSLDHAIPLAIERQYKNDLMNILNR